MSSTLIFLRILLIASLPNVETKSMPSSAIFNRLARVFSSKGNVDKCLVSIQEKNIHYCSACRIEKLYALAPKTCQILKPFYKDRVRVIYDIVDKKKITDKGDSVGIEEIINIQGCNDLVLLKFWDNPKLNEPDEIKFSEKSFGKNEPIQCTVINWKQLVGFAKEELDNVRQNEKELSFTTPPQKTVANGMNIGSILYINDELLGMGIFSISPDLHYVHIPSFRNEILKALNANKRFSSSGQKN